MSKQTFYVLLGGTAYNMDRFPELSKMKDRLLAITYKDDKNIPVSNFDQIIAEFPRRYRIKNKWFKRQYRETLIRDFIVVHPHGYWIWLMTDTVEVQEVEPIDFIKKPKKEYKPIETISIDQTTELIPYDSSRGNNRA